MSPQQRSRAAFVVLLLALFSAGTVMGYVYRHNPQPDVVTVRVAPRPASNAPRVISGTVSAVEGGKLTLATDNGPVTVSLPSGVAVDQLVRAAAGIPAGTAVNVGVASTQYGLALTGIVAIEGAR